MKDELEKIICKLDTASGMLIVAAMTDNKILEAMKIVSQASFDLGNLTNNMEGGEKFET